MKRLSLQRHDYLDIQPVASLTGGKEYINPDKPNYSGSPEILKNFDSNEIVLYSLSAIKVNQRGWKQQRQIIVTTKGLYNFNKNSRFGLI